MALKVGGRVLGRYELTRELPGTADLWRWEARDPQTGAAVEVVAPRLMAALRPEAAGRFEAAGEARVEHPAFEARLAEGQAERLPVAVRPLGGGPWPAEARLEAAEVEAIAAWLGPAILGLDPPLVDGLRAEDLRLDGEGVPRLAPTGLVHGGAVNDPPRHRPPELRAGGRGGAEAALYGLGALLFRAATGQEAVPGDSAAAWAQASPRRARALRPELPASTEALLAGLLSADPAERRAAVLALPSPASPPRLALAAPPAPPTTARLERRAGAPPAARLDVGLGRWSVAVRPSTLSAPASRRAAALAGAWTSALREAGGADGWVAIAELRSRAEAEARAASLAELGVASRVLAGELPRAKTALAVLLLGLGGLLGLAGLLLWPLLLVAALALTGGLALGAAALGVRGAQRSAAEGKARLVEAVRAPDPASAPERALATARLQVLEAELPDAARRDLLDRLDEVEDGLAASGDAATAHAEAERARASLASLTRGAVG